MQQFNFIIEAIKETMRSPASNPTRSAFLAAAALVLVLIVVLLLLLLLTPGKRKVVKVRRYRRRPADAASDAQPVGADGSVPVAAATLGAASLADASDAQDGSQPGPEDAEADELPTEPGPDQDAKKASKAEARKRRARIERNVTAWGIPILIFAALISGYYITGSDAYCAKTCHANQPAVKAAVTLNHASCVDCHEQPGVLAIPGNVASRFSMVVGQVRGKSPAGVVLVPSQSCVRCHSTTIETVSVSSTGVRMSHSQPTAAGYTCTACHPVAGHAARKTYSMSSCLPCHDGTKASSACITCHAGDAIQSAVASAKDSTGTIGSGNVIYPVVDVASTNCGGCHDQAKQCDTCHGLRMPHSDEFVASGHARYAAFSGKQMCWKCHTQAFCGECHMNFLSEGHASNWATTHGATGWQGGCSCHAARVGGLKTSFCYLCHQPAAPHALRPLTGQ